MGLVSHKERCPGNPKVKAFIDDWDVNGPFPIVILRGGTTDKLQLLEYAKGRMQQADGTWVVVNQAEVVTNARKGSDSAHGHGADDPPGAGIDCHPVISFYPNGLPHEVYLGTEKDPAVRAEGLRRFAIYDERAKQFGLETGELYPGVCDRPHACDPAWKTLPLAPGVAA